MLLILGACSTQNEKSKTMLQQDPKIVTRVIDALQSQYADLNVERARKGVEQAAALWYDTDGSADDFLTFCTDNYVSDETFRLQLFNNISNLSEIFLNN